MKDYSYLEVGQDGTVPIKGLLSRLKVFHRMLFRKVNFYHSISESFICTLVLGFENLHHLIEIHCGGAVINVTDG